MQPNEKPAIIIKISRLEFTASIAGTKSANTAVASIIPTEQPSIKMPIMLFSIDLSKKIEPAPKTVIKKIKPKPKDTISAPDM